jgi:hypothetical protein
MIQEYQRKLSIIHEEQRKVYWPSVKEMGNRSQNRKILLCPEVKKMMIII